MIKYLGSKRLLIPQILAAVRAAVGERAGVTVLDLFSGTSRVGHALKREGRRVIANDHLAFAHTLATCYVQADREDVVADAAVLIDELNAVPDGASEPGWFTDCYAVQARFFHPSAAARIETLRERIAAKGLPPELEAVLLTALLHAADRVDCTAAVQMAYLKEYPPRAFKRVELRLPDVLPRPAAGRCEAHCLDALDAAVRWSEAADVAYIDPPYNQHSYLGNYHIWETLVRWDRPEVFGRARKRIDVRTRKSEFNSRTRCRGAFERLIAAVRSPVLIVSFNDEGYLAPHEIESILAGHGEVSRTAVESKRYVGAQIGIHNPAGEKVGVVGHLRNTELIYTLRRA
jgi:adenine-specific DNA-methyltransferase